MQTSDSSSFQRPVKFRTTRAAGVGAAIGMTLLVTSGWLACSPGELDCSKVDCVKAGSGGGGEGGEGGAGGSGGMGGAGGSGGGGGAPEACKNIMVNSLDEFETKFIIPKCGMSACHQAVFPPRNLHMKAMIRTAMVDKAGVTLCKNDKYINKADVSKSYVLAKITATEEKVTCPSGGDGGVRMPNIAVGMVGPRLNDDEIACFTWYVETLADM